MSNSRYSLSKTGKKPDSEYLTRFRGLGEYLSGVIFGCTDETKDECLRDLVFGLPITHWDYVQKITEGLPLFLFNYSTREMYGVFVAASKGTICIKPQGWTDGSGRKTEYPAQVRAKWYKKGGILKECQFKKLIRENYNLEGPLFHFELDVHQVSRFCEAFHSSVPRKAMLGRSPILDPPMVKETNDSACRTPAAPATDPTVSRQNTAMEGHAQSKLLIVKKPSTSTKSVFDHIESLLQDNDTPYGGTKSKSKKKSKTSVQKKPQISRSEGSRFRSSTRSGCPTTVKPANVAVPTFSGHATGVFILKTQEKNWKIPPDTIPLKKRQTLAQANGLASPRPRTKSLEPVADKTVVSDKNIGAHSDSKIEQRDTLLELILSKDDSRLLPNLKEESIVLLGGFDGSKSFAKVEIGVGGGWTENIFLPDLDGLDGQSVAIDQNIFTLRGNRKVCSLYSVKRGDKKWNRLSSVPKPRGGFASTTVDNGIFVLGGGSACNEEETCYHYDCISNSWQVVPSLEEAMFGMAACVHQETLYVCGGGRGEVASDSFALLDPRTSNWQKLPRMRQKRKHHCVISHGGMIWAIGGQSSDGILLSSVEAFDWRGDSWTEVTPMNDARAYFSVESVGGSMVVLGGIGNLEEHTFLGMEMFDSQFSKWSRCGGVGITGKRGYHSSCTVKP